MSTPTAQEKINAQQNLGNMYDILDDLQLDFSEVMYNLTELLSDPSQDDPGQGDMEALISAMVVIIGGLGSAITGGAAIPIFAGLAGVAYNAVSSSPPFSLNGQLANYSERFVGNIHALQANLATYAGNLDDNWDESFLNPADNKNYPMSSLGQAGFFPGKDTNLDLYNSYRVGFRRAADFVTWKYFLPRSVTIAVRDNQSPGGSMDQLGCKDCFTNEDNAWATFQQVMYARPIISGDYFTIKSTNGNCSDSSDTSITFSWWSLETSATAWLSEDVIRYVIKDDGMGTIWNPKGLAMRSDVFLNWGLPRTQLLDYTQYGASCNIVHAGSSSVVDNTVEKPASLDNTIIGVRDFSGKPMAGIFMKGTAGNDVYARGATLDNADMSGARLPGIDLRNASLKSAGITNADLGGADFRGADLTGADFSGSFLRGADFTGAVTTGAKFVGADISNVAGLTALTTDRIMPLRHTTIIDTAPRPTAEEQENLVIELAAIAGQTIAKGLLQPLLSLLPANQRYTYNYELPVQGNSGTVSVVLRTRGEAGAGSFAGLLKHQQQDAQSFLNLCQQMAWPGVGLRISVAAGKIDLQPFIDGPIGWQEIKAVLPQVGSTNQSALQSFTDATDTQSLYAWNHNAADGSDEIAMRIRPANAARFQQVAQLAGMTISETDPLYSMVANAGSPAVVFLKSVQGKAAPRLAVYLPVTSASKLSAYPLTDAGKEVIKAMLQQQKIKPPFINAIQVERTEAGEEVMMYLG